MHWLDDALMRADLKARMFGRACSVRVGRFDVERKLGEGGMGVVYVARDSSLDRPVALKLLQRESQRLQREARALARLSHPNVVTIHEVGELDGRTYIAMEFVAGRTIRQWCEEDGPAWNEVVEVYLQAGAGLAAAHAVGIVHRDFKPDNVIHGDDGRVRVLDFGLARATDGEVGSGAHVPATLPEPGGATLTAGLGGTPGYMAPEQILGVTIDARADQFAFCVALYEALHGERPHVGETAPEYAESVLTGRLRPVRDPSLVPRAIDEVLRRGLQTHASDRYETLEDLLSDLRHARVVSEPRRGRVWPATTLAVALALGGIGVAVLMLPAEPVEDDDAGGDGEVRAVSMGDDSSPDERPSRRSWTIPAHCPGFRDTTPDATDESYRGRLQFLLDQLPGVSDDGRHTPETLLWIAEYQLRIGELERACVALERLSTLREGDEYVERGRCWRDVLCVPEVAIECPTGTVPGPGLDGCRLAEPECSVPLEGDLEAWHDALEPACAEDELACCARLGVLHQGRARIAEKAGDSAEQGRQLERMLARYEPLCDRGDALICEYAAKVRREGGPGIPPDSERADALQKRACDLGRVSACSRSR